MTVKKTIKCYYKICYHKRFDESESAVAKFILEKLGQFKYVYILYFLAEIYHLLAMLLKVISTKICGCYNCEQYCAYRDNSNSYDIHCRFL